MALVAKDDALDAPPGGGKLLWSENGSGEVDQGDEPTVIASPTKYAPTKAPASVKEKGSAKNYKNDEVTFLVEIVKVAIPKRRGNDGGVDRGLHCTTRWVGPTNPSGRKRVDKVLHRTKSLKIDKTAVGDCDADTSKNDLAIASSDSTDSENGVDEVPCVEKIFTVNDDSLFLFKTTMKQLVNASVDSSSSDATSIDVDANGTFDYGGMRFDVFEEPLDMLNSVYATVLANNISEKEANAITRESSSYASFRLIGSIFLSPEEILSKCDEERFECSLMQWRHIHQQQHGVGFQRMTPKRVDGGRLALRIRLASEFDVAFLKSLARNNTLSNGASVALHTTLIESSGNKHLKPAMLTTEMDESILTAQCSMRALENLSPIAQEGVRYLLSNDTEKRVLVKPCPDPARPEDSTWFTEEELLNECYKPSTNWIQAGQGGSGSLGKVYLEILECRGLPNTDAGGAVGNKTDAFVSVVYGDVMVQTEVIDDSCSPMWMPWTSRAFVFQMSHPSTAIYIGVADYDFGPLEHECIGRVAIDLEKYFPGTQNNLTFKLYESSNLTDRGEDQGTITVRLRIEIPNEKKYLMKGWKAPERKWVNSQAWKSHRVAKYCVDGAHDDEVFQMSLFRSHINELLTQKRYLSYAISDALRSLVFWRGQVKVGETWIPLHSAVVFYFSIQLVEKPELAPSFFLFGCGWIMIANMMQRASQPNPWRAGHSFLYYWNVLIHGKSSHAAGKVIRPNQGHKEASKIESKWKQRLADADAEYARQAELDAKIKTISDDTVIRTKAKANGALADPISAVAGARLLPYQKRLSGYCNRVRYIRNVMNWNESIISFFITLILFGSGCVSLFIPWRFILQWTSRILVWLFLGPWMRILDLFFHEESDRQKAKAANKAMKLFRDQRKTAKLLREHALKMKAFRVKLFGQFITRLPEFNLTRHEDVPLPQSYSEPYHPKNKEIQTTKYVPSQDLTGKMIPMTGQDAAECRAKRQNEKEGLLSQYQTMLEGKPNLLSDSEGDQPQDVDEGFELITTENQVVCIPSASSDDAKETEENAYVDSTHPRSSSVGDATISDKAIQQALEKAENNLQECKQTKIGKTKWVFSAQIRMSFKKETAEVLTRTPPRIPAIDTGPISGLIGQMEDKDLIEDCVQEEGVEVVPLIESGAADPDTPSRVSVLYVKESPYKFMGDVNTTEGGRETRDDDNVTARVVKRITDNTVLDDID